MQYHQDGIYVMDQMELLIYLVSLLLDIVLVIVIMMLVILVVLRL